MILPAITNGQQNVPLSHFLSNKITKMQIGAMNHPARDPISEIEWIGKNAFDFVEFTPGKPSTFSA